MRVQIPTSTSARLASGHIKFSGSPGWVTPQLYDQPVYSVFDAETTGFRNTDEIIELAIVRVSGQKIVSKWATLLNPGPRDLGPTHIHKINHSDLTEAPRLADVLGDVFALLHGTVLVGHSVAFDMRMVKNAIKRQGIDPALFEWSAFDTQKLAPLFDAPSKKLIDVATAAGVVLSDAHAALPDTVATAELLIKAQAEHAFEVCTPAFPGIGRIPGASGKALVRVPKS